MKKITFLAFILLVSAIAFCQENQKKVMKEKFEDEIRQDEENQMTLRFLDAKTGDGIPYAVVTIQDIGEYKTDMEGKMLFPFQEEDKIILCSFSCQGYITTIFKTEVVAGTLFYNRFSVSPLLKLGSIRIVLDWDAKPGDLDAHLMKNGGTAYHVSFRNTRIAADGMAMLDRDDLDGFGPETITATEISNDAEYEYFVHDYSNQSNQSSNSLSVSRAHVLVYGNDRLLNEFSVPVQKNGVKWSVLKIINGQIVPQNRLE